MAHYASTSAHHATALGRVAAALAGWWREVRLARRRAETAAALHRLNDRTLKDIGLTRDDIDNAVRSRLMNL